jgi:hypothetical protein
LQSPVAEIAKYSRVVHSRHKQNLWLLAGHASRGW